MRSRLVSRLLAVVDPRRIERQLHVLLQRAAAAGNERGVGAAQAAGRVETCRSSSLCGPRVGIDGPRKERRVERHAGRRIVRAGDAGEERAHVRAERGLADDRLDVVDARRPCGSERTIANLSARLASRGNVPPNVTPGSVVSISPVTLRMPAGASILGSNVSVWLGPPCRNRKMTLLPVTGRSRSFAPAACVASKFASDRPPRPRLPMRRKSRRPKRSRESWIVSMGALAWGRQAG